jgi:hypothetical protein
MLDTKKLASGQFWEALQKNLLDLFHSYLAYILPFIPFIIWLLVIFLVFYIFLTFYAFVTSLRKKTIFLQLTPPARTDKTAYTTQQLFLVLHNAGMQKSF